MKERSLATLKTLQKRLRESPTAQTKTTAAAAAAPTLNTHDLFVQAVGTVQPLLTRARQLHPPKRPSPQAVQRQADEARVMKDALSDEFDVQTLLQTDEQLSYTQAGIGSDVVRKLRQGHWSIQRHLDLHGLRTEEARQALSEFLRQAQQTGVRCVRVIHGKGLGSPGGTPVLKNRVLRWLVQKEEVLVFVQARPEQGGAGALLVLLKGRSR